MTAQLVLELEGGAIAPETAIVPEPDRLMERIIAAGLAPNAYVLCLNRGLTNPDSIPFPSRAFRFPIEFIELSRLTDQNVPDEQRLLLRHPGLSDLPFVADVAKKLGVAPSWAPLDEFGRDRIALPRLWHASDLMSETHWRDLLRTKSFTGVEEIARAVSHRLTGHRQVAISTATARAVLAAIGSVEPGDRSTGLVRKGGLGPAFIRDDKPHKPGRWALNLNGESEPNAWIAVHSLEDGWITYGTDGYATLSPKGQRYLGLDSPAALQAAENRGAGLSGGGLTARPRRHGR